MHNRVKASLRLLWRRRTFTFLNVLGLSVGLGACLVLFLIIRYELNFDGYHSKKDRIYRVTSAYTGGSQGTHFFQGVPYPLPASLRGEFPQFEKVAAVFGAINAQITVPGSGAKEDLKIKVPRGVVYAEPSLFDIVDQPWVMGEPGTALSEPNRVALDVTLAKAWFGKVDNAMGKVIYLDQRTPLTVSGILTDPPGNTDLAMKIVISYATFPERNNTNWHNTVGNFTCYALLRKDADIQAVSAGMDAFANKYYKNDGTSEKTSFYIQPFTDIHFDPRMGSFSGTGTPPGFLWSLALLGTFLVLIACVNFINLSTAQAVQRSREVGVRKSLGSSRGMLILQFLGETAMIVLPALILACVFAELALPFVRGLLKEPVELDYLKSPSTLVFLLTSGVAVTILAGFYPALILSGFNATQALKNTLNTRNASGVFLKRGLVIFQFMIAQVLMIGTVIVLQQINYLKQLPWGFDKNAVVMIPLPTDSTSIRHFALVKSQALAIPGVEAVSLCSDAPTSRRTISSSFSFEGHEEEFDLSIRKVDSDYFRTFQIGLVAGRLPLASDTTREYLLNEVAVRKLGFQDVHQALGRMLDMDKHAPVVGVVKDFNSGAPMNAIPPLVLSAGLANYEFMAVRFDPAHMQGALDKVKSAWESTFPGYVYEQQFLDETVAQYFTMMDSAQILLRVFAAIAILVSCLGLYGLVAFMAVQKTKEIGIRKVLGASVQNIVLIFSREFTALIGLSFLLSAPLGYIMMHKLLESLNNRIEIGAGAFIVVLVASMLLAWLAVGYLAARAALTEPAKSLRTE